MFDDFVDELLMVGNQIGSFDLAEIRFDLLEHFQPAGVTLVASRRLRVFRLGFGILQHERIVIDAQEAGAAGIGAAAADANEAGQLEAGRADLLGDVRTERWELHAAHRQVAVMQQERRPRMAAFLAGHRADDGDVVHRGGAFRQAVGDLNAGNGRRDRLGLAAVFVAGLGLNVSNWLGPPPIQSRMQAMPRLRRSSADRQIASVQLIMPAAAPVAAATRKKSRRCDDAVAIRAGVDVMFEFEVHVE